MGDQLDTPSHFNYTGHTLFTTDLQFASTTSVRSSKAYQLGHIIPHGSFSQIHYWPLDTNILPSN